MSDLPTKSKRPPMMRPATGLLAWQATVGHISARHSPDAVLKLQITSKEARVVWAAALSWAHKEEEVTGQSSLPEALRKLWEVVNRNHRIFDHVEDAVKSPQNYDDTEWIDIATQESMQRLVWVTQSVFPGDWKIVILYQPVDAPNLRMQARLTAQGGRVAVGGQGASLLEACRALFRNATPYYGGGAQGTPP